MTNTKTELKNTIIRAVDLQDEIKKADKKIFTDKVLDIVDKNWELGVEAVIAKVNEEFDSYIESKEDETKIIETVVNELENKVAVELETSLSITNYNFKSNKKRKEFNLLTKQIIKNQVYECKLSLLTNKTGSWDINKINTFSEMYSNNIKYLIHKKALVYLT